MYSCAADNVTGCAEMLHVASARRGGGQRQHMNLFNKKKTTRVIFMFTEVMFLASRIYVGFDLLQVNRGGAKAIEYIFYQEELYKGGSYE